MPTYGRTFVLADKNVNGMNAPSVGGGPAGEYTKESGFLSFYEICDLLKNGATYYWDDEQKVPYLINNNLWVGFDDERSILNKMKWILENDYGGAMVWTLDMDDFNGNCAGIKYPLIGIMAQEMIGRPRGKSTFASIVKKASIKVSDKTTAPSPEINLILKKEEKHLAVVSEMTSNVTSNTTNARIVCYFTRWSMKRSGAGKFKPEFLDPNLCTHVVYAFAELKDNQIVEETSDKELFEKLKTLKDKNPNLKLLLAVGGWMVGPSPFKLLTENVYRQTLFIFNVIDFLRKQNFDGLDLCWEFPRGPEDKQKFTGLVKELKEAFEGEAKVSKKLRLLLTAAVPASFEAISAGYDVPEINK